MTKIIVSLLIFIFFLFSHLDAQERLLKQKWIKKDIAIFHSLIDFLESDTLSLESFNLNVMNIDVQNERLIWSNCTRIEAAQYGGYITNWITLCALKGEIFELTIRLSPEDSEVLQVIANNDKRIKSELETNWRYSEMEIPGESNKIQYDLHFENQSVRIDFEEEVKSILGGMVEVELKEELQKYYDLLINPIYSYDYGDNCYYAGSKPIGRVAIEKLMQENRIDLIQNVIRGYNPEGRAYGIEALLKINSQGGQIITNEDKKVISWLIKSNFLLSTCQGCIVRPNNYNDLFGK